MAITFSLILIVMGLVGIFTYRLCYRGKVESVNKALAFISISGVFTMFSCALCTLTTDRYLLLIFYTLFYSTYAIMIFAFARYAYVYSTSKTREIFKEPLFYGTIAIILLLLYNVYSQNMFVITLSKFAGFLMPSTIYQGSFLPYLMFLALECTVSLLYFVTSLIRCAPIYKYRYIVMIAVSLFHLVLELFSLIYSWPIAVKSLFLLFEGWALVYITNIYSTKTLTVSVLHYVSDNNVNGLLIYDENNSLIYHNKIIEDMFLPEMLMDFEDIKKLDEWSKDLVEFNGIYLKPIMVGDEERYFNIYRHDFVENESYIGTSFSFHDTTESFEKIAMIEESNEELKRAAHMKSDFLANMSHEIRTPMNAVIGLAEMALREEMTDQARDYLSQIKSSGRNLLNIINDILDFSKIESGKMDIIPAPYEPLSEFNDVANTLITRIGEKDIELTMEENPNLPSKLEGDVLRIRQILINLANNAIKFTNHGRVQIISDFEPIDDTQVMLRFHVLDTGMGIKKEDLKKLFVSFQQVDSKRNRSIEGTGLGLAISKSLVETMGGTIGVESEYGKGSDFYFEIPQKIVDPAPSVTVNDPENIFAIGMFRKKYLARRFFIDTSRMGVYSTALKYYEDYDDMCDLYADMIDNRRKYIFFEEGDYKSHVRDMLLNEPDLIGVMIAEFTSTFKPDLKNLRMIKKPFSTAAIAMALNNMELHLNNEDGKAFVSDFTAPDARILIVDDNMVNLTVAEGLLQPLKMHIDCVVSGKDAIDRIGVDSYDIVFMDHMMPEMDGVETTHIIRRMFPELKDMPIIALTANAVSGVKEFFIKEGMNDFVPKPIEVRDIMAKVKQWLPEGKVLKGYEMVDIVENENDEDISITGLDSASAIKMIGSNKLYLKILTEYYRNIRNNHEQLKTAFANEDWDDYTIKVHALKSSSKQIGAMELSEKAAKLEAAGKSKDIDYIMANSKDALDEYIALEPLLKPYCESEQDETDKPLIDANTLYDLLSRTVSASEDLDMDAMETIIEELRKYTFEDGVKENIDSMIEAAELMDVFTASEIAQKLLDM